MISVDLQAERRVYADRARWVTQLVFEVTDDAGLRSPPQAAALFAEMVQVFCSGAWVATVILAQAVLEADLAESEWSDGMILNELRYGRGYVWLRERRNHLVHADGPGPAITVASRQTDATALERDARRAVELAIRGLAGRV